MRPSLLPLLACPVCRGGLSLAAAEGGRGPDGSIEEGTLSCAACRLDYPVSGSIPRLRPPRPVEARAAKTRESFGWEWLRYPGRLPEDESVLLEEIQLPAAELSGKLVLDAGCGMGRYSAAAARLGATVVALDVSESLVRVAEAARADPSLHPVEGDLLAPPLRPGSFDLAFSHGVLHHTSDTAAAFRALAPLVKRGGLLSVWLYGRAGRYAEFASNPLKAGREGLARWRPAAWVLVGLRHAASDLLRAFTTRLPVRAAYALCYPLAWLGAVPLAKYLTFSVHPSFRVRLIENFDWVSPPHQWHHTKEELRAWFEAAGYEALKVLPHGLVPKPGVLGRRR